MIDRETNKNKNGLVERIIRGDRKEDKRRRQIEMRRDRKGDKRVYRQKKGEG